MTGSPVTYDFDMAIKTLSIFVDESGRFQYPDADSRFYILSMVLHNQEIDITDEVLHLDYKFRQMHLERLCFHAGPLIRQGWDGGQALVFWEGGKPGTGTSRLGR